MKRLPVRALEPSGNAGDVAVISGGIVVWQPPAAGGGGSYTRTTATKTTATLADAATESGSIAIDVGFRAYKISTSAAARVRLYATAAQRDADASRPVGTDPTGDHGLLLEYVTTGAVSASLSPLVDGASLEATPSANIPASVTNLSGASAAITVTITYLKTE